METTDIKPGDVVRLKSGGPNMTVTQVADHDTTLSAWCTWFSGPKLDKVEEGVFAVVALTRATSTYPTIAGPRR